MVDDHFDGQHTCTGDCRGVVFSRNLRDTIESSFLYHSSPLQKEHWCVTPSNLEHYHKGVPASIPPPSVNESYNSYLRRLDLEQGLIVDAVRLFRVEVPRLLGATQAAADSPNLMSVCLHELMDPESAPSVWKAVLTHLHIPTTFRASQTPGETIIQNLTALSVIPSTVHGTRFDDRRARVHAITDSGLAQTLRELDAKWDLDAMSNALGCSHAPVRPPANRKPQTPKDSAR